MFDLDKINFQSLFALYILIASSFLDKLFGCTLQRFFTENIYVKNLLISYFVLFYYFNRKRN